ncbi:MAG TPA: hypothetical protein PKH77_27630 [Anaerolineae bacterium]|nr:hypothetical protein [Anaerolineae bacterium]
MKDRRFLLALGLGVTLLSLFGLSYAGQQSALNAQAAALPANSAAPAMESAHFGLDWDVVGAGGSEIASTHFRVASTIGQPATGNLSSAHFAAHTGYWQTLSTTHRVYLPLVMRDA